MMHDCGLTKRHMIFVDAPLFFRPEEMVKSGRLPFVFEKTEPLRLGVLNRYATSASDVQGSKNSVKWFTLEPGMCFHVANAWEIEGENKIEVHLCRFNDFSLDSFTAVSADADPHLTRVVLDLDSGLATSQQLLDLCGDFPVVPASKIGRPTKFAYVATFETSKDVGMPLFYGVAKVDLEAAGSTNAVAGLISFGEGRLGGECYFAPREGGADEDDGYLMTFVYDEVKGESEFVVYDAKTMSGKPVVRVGLGGRRVPFGFHSLFVCDAQLKSQAPVVV